MTEAVAQSNGTAGGSLGRVVGVLEITEPTGEKRLVPFEADVGDAKVIVNEPPAPLT